MLCSCSDDEDKSSNDIPVISGPAILHVINNTPYSQLIRFDNIMIGSVAAHSTRDWNVPTGRHLINGYDSIYGNSSGYYNFFSGQTTPVTFFLGSKNTIRGALHIKSIT